MGYDDWKCTDPDLERPTCPECDGGVALDGDILYCHECDYSVTVSFEPVTVDRYWEDDIYG